MKASILKAINDISSMEEMNELIGLINMKTKSLRSASNRAIKASLITGDDVVIKGRESLGVGKILEVKRTKAIVLINNDRWNVSLTLIEKA